MFTIAKHTWRCNTKVTYVLLVLNNIFHLYLKNGLGDLSPVNLLKSNKEQDRAAAINSV